MADPSRRPAVENNIPLVSPVLGAPAVPPQPATKRETEHNEAAKEQHQLTGQRLDPTSPLTDPCTGPGIPSRDASVEGIRVREAMVRAQDAKKDKPIEPKIKGNHRRAVNEKLTCMLCGATSEGSSGKSQTIKRLYNPTLTKFARIPVEDNPFAKIDVDNPPSDIAICHNDRVWINNLWVNGKRYSLPGIWTRRDEDGNTVAVPGGGPGKPASTNGRRKPGANRPKPVKEPSAPPLIRPTRKIPTVASALGLPDFHHMPQPPKLPIEKMDVVGLPPTSAPAVLTQGSTVSAGCADPAGPAVDTVPSPQGVPETLKRSRETRARNPRWVGTDVDSKDPAETDDDDDADFEPIEHQVLKKLRPTYRKNARDSHVPEPPMKTKDQVAALVRENMALRREMLELRTIVENGAAHTRVLDAAIRNLLDSPIDDVTRRQ